MFVKVFYIEASNTAAHFLLWVTLWVTNGGGIW